MTFIYLLRHGIATDRELCPEDEGRELTPQGIEKTTAVAQKLHELGLRCDLILTSPLVRAKQTAQILATEFSGTALEVVDWLAPEGSFGAWEDWLDQNQVPDSLFLVGHEPDLSMWAELMIWGGVSGNILLKKAGILGLVRYPDRAIKGSCTLFLLAPPKILLGK